MGPITSQITSLTIVYLIVYSDADQRKHQSSASLAFVRGIHRGQVNSSHKWPVTRKMFPFDDVIMIKEVSGVVNSLSARCRIFPGILSYPVAFYVDRFQFITDIVLGHWTKCKRARLTKTLFNFNDTRESTMLLDSSFYINPLHIRHNGRGGILNHQHHDCLLICLFCHRSKKTSKLRVTGLCEGNSTVTGEFPAQRASNAKNGSIWWRHHADRGSNIYKVTVKKPIYLIAADDSFIVLS